MLDVFSVTGPIYITIAIGYIATRFGPFAAADMRSLGRYVLNLALPMLLFRALAQKPVAEIANPAYIAAYLGGTIVMVLVGYLAVRKLLGHERMTAAISAMGMSCPNSGFVGFPIMLLTFPPIAGTVLALNMFVENVFVVPLLLVLAERAKGEEGHPLQVMAGALVRLVRNPLVIGLVAGLLVSLGGLRLPGPVEKTVDIFAQSSAALSLFTIGGMLVGLPVRGLAGRIVPVVLGKLLVHPAIMLLALSALPVLGFAPLETPYREALVLSAAMPIFGIYPILAQNYGEEGFGAVALLATTVASFATVSVLLWYFTA
ncbi:AEC family transporter [Oricola thermophila]|uniref:AEC family transporter n=1 Tax=Oricola thermophila TaxID=2742145 RepID=A0A6N1VH41_9HYPH|nr:AEC family transporter [Oricola thermophila]QKV18469.1 AEC family transporter [Oricola thermophila]